MMPTVPSPSASGYTRSTDVPLYWARYGPQDAPPLLLLHGGPGAHHDYLLPQFLTLATEWSLVFYDQRGGGRSRTDDRAPIGWRTHVDDMERVIDELGLGAVMVLGYSWGGLLALLFTICADRGEVSPAPQRLALIDPAPITRAYRDRFEAALATRQRDPAIASMREELAASGLREQDPEAYRQRAFELSVAGYFADPAAARNLTPFRVTGRVQQSTWESLGDFDLREALGRIRIPALIVHGSEDPIPIESSMDAARALGARLVVLEGSGHVPYVERPDSLFAAVQRFLREADPRSGDAPLDTA